MSASVRVLWVLLLALLAAPALALGLGQIKVKSQHGQPLLAEIPILSSDPSELDNLQARLASPETFARIGLEPPEGLVSDLQFSVALDARGQPIVRITSQAPVQQSLLSFLVEVDWGQGRLVREYSALIDAPESVSAVSQPQIQAPQLSAPNTIVRQPTLPEPSLPSPGESSTTSAAVPPPPAPVATPAPRQTIPVAPVAAVTPARVDAPPPAPAATAATAPAPREVRSGQVLSQIARDLARGGDHSLNQTMLALLRANPDAFIGGNINRIRQGAVLRVPAANDYVHSLAEADALVRQQVSQWRESRRPVTQPETVLAADAATTGPTSADPAIATATPAAATRTNDARLAIVPAVAGNEHSAGTRSGLSAGGEGDMLRQQELVQTKETLAAREAELAELKTRVSELEQLQQQQAQLITMKDSELAAVQQRLAATDQRSAEPTPSAAAGTAQPVGGLPWIWLGAGLVVLALLVLWRRRRATERRPVFDSAALAAAMPVDASADVTRADNAGSRDAGGTTPAPFVDRVEPSFAVPPAREPVPALAPVPEPAPEHEPGPLSAMPTWHAGQGSGHAAIVLAPEPDLRDDIAPAFEQQTSGRGMAGEPVPVEQAPDGRAASAQDAFATQEPAGQARIELARAYLDLGDVDTARSLLQEVANTGDAASRDDAARLLRTLA